MKNIFLIFLILVMSTTKIKPSIQPAANGGIAIGVVVLVVGGVATYWLIKKCQKWFPRDENSSTNNPVINLPPGHAAKYVWEDNSGCEFQPAAMQLEKTIFNKISYTFNSHINNKVIINSISKNRLLTASEFEVSNLASYGLDLDLGVQGGGSFIGFPDLNKPVVYINDEINSPSHKVVLQTSTDLKHWKDILTTYVPTDSNLVIYDSSTESKLFYRFKLGE